jgi:hypothetical protein
VDVPARTHTPPVQFASVSHVVVEPEELQGCPSGITVGHVPAWPPESDHGHEPTRHRAVAPHGWPPATHASVAQACVVTSQPRPPPQSVSALHRSPACPAFWHVDELAGGKTGHTSDPLQSLVSAQGAPAPPGALHAPRARLQLRPGLHRVWMPSHLAPASPKVTGRHVPTAPASEKPEIWHVVSGPHVALPQFGPVPHCPHVRVPPSGACDPAVQSPFWHWSSLRHEAPPARDPGPNVHAELLSAEHPEAATALAQASSVLAVIEIPGSARSAAHAWSKRPWIRARSLAGGGTPSQLPAKMTSK